MQKNVEVEVDAEMAAILQISRFSSDFTVRMLDKEQPDSDSTPQVAYSFGSVLFIYIYVLHLWFQCIV